MGTRQIGAQRKNSRFRGPNPTARGTTHACKSWTVNNGPAAAPSPPRPISTPAPKHGMAALSTAAEARLDSGLHRLHRGLKSDMLSCSIQPRNRRWDCTGREGAARGRIGSAAGWDERHGQRGLPEGSAAQRGARMLVLVAGRWCWRSWCGCWCVCARVLGVGWC